MACTRRGLGRVCYVPLDQGRHSRRIGDTLKQTSFVALDELVQGSGSVFSGSAPGFVRIGHQPALR